ncbi:hypothetical protein FKM82_006736 [Ascaphus truei]
MSILQCTSRLVAELCFCFGFFWPAIYLAQRLSFTIISTSTCISITGKEYICFPQIQFHCFLECMLRYAFHFRSSGYFKAFGVLLYKEAYQRSIFSMY